MFAMSINCKLLWCFFVFRKLWGERVVDVGRKVHKCLGTDNRATLYHNTTRECFMGCWSKTSLFAVCCVAVSRISSINIHTHLFDSLFKWDSESQRCKFSFDRPQSSDFYRLECLHCETKFMAVTKSTKMLLWFFFSTIWQNKTKQTFQGKGIKRTIQNLIW